MRTPSWVELLVLRVHGPGGPDPTVHGTIRSRDAADARGNSMGWVVTGGAPPPVMAGAGATPGEDGDVVGHVWRDGARVRLEDADRVPRVIADEGTVWTFREDPTTPTAAPRSTLVLAGAGHHLLTRRDANEFASDDFTRPTGAADGAGAVGATTFLGRPAWTVELAPPPRKPHPMQVVVDAETGFVLQQRVDAVGAVDEWLDLEVGVPLSPALFSWDGPVRPATSARDAARAAQEADRRRWADWFGDAVGPLERTAVVGVELDLTVRWVHTFDPATGAFEASLGEGLTTATLARRPRSSEPWHLSGAGTHRWSTPDHDWAFTCVDLTLTPDGLAAVERLFTGP